MQTTISSDDISLALHSELEVPPKTTSSPWIELWWKNWSYAQWLLSSMITTVITTEVYTILLSVYPNFMLNFWISLGLTSLTLSTVLTYALILSAGLLTGWLVYSAHLAFMSLRAANNDYQPLIELWTTYNQDSSSIVSQLLNDDNFLKLSKFLKDQPLPADIQAFLSNKAHLGDIKKLMDLLTKIWSIENMEEKLKTLTLEILSKCAASPDHVKHIDNISTLCHLLIDMNQFNQDMVTKTLKNSEQLNPYISELSALNKDKDLLHKLIEEPRLMPFYIAMQDSFKDEADRVARNTELLYYYLRFDLTNPTAMTEFENQHKTPLSIKPTTYNWLKQDYFNQPKDLSLIWDKFTHHPFKDWVEPIFGFMMAHDKYRDVLTHARSCQEILNLFHQPLLLGGEEFTHIKESLDYISDHNQLPLLCDILLYLHSKANLQVEMIESLIKNRRIDVVYQAIHTGQPLSQENLSYIIEHGRLMPVPPASMPITEPKASKKSFSSLFSCFSSAKDEEKSTNMSLKPS